jgi:hypothetical protein
MTQRNNQVADPFDKAHRALFVSIMRGNGHTRQMARRAWQLRAKGAISRVSRETQQVFNDVTLRMTSVQK